MEDAFIPMDELFQQAEYFYRCNCSHNADFMVLNILTLMQEFNHLNEADAMREYAVYRRNSTGHRIVVNYNVNIIAGSMPCRLKSNVLKCIFMPHRNGKVEKYEKIHITQTK
jgi:hypothetical protein